MATLTVGDLTPRDQYTATSGQTVFTYSFPIFSDSDLKVYVGSTLKTLSSDYTVTAAGTSSGGTVVFGSVVTTGAVVTIYRDLPVARTTDYATGGALLAENLNDDLDKLVMMVQQQEDQLKNNTLTVDQFDEYGNLTLPSKTARVGRVLGFNATTGDPEAGPSIANVSSLASITSAIDTVAGIDTDVTDVAGIKTDVTSVAGKVSQISLLGTADAIADMNTLGTADVVSDMNTLANSDIISDLNTLASSDIVSDMNTLATADVVSDMNTLATSAIVADMDALADKTAELGRLGTADAVADMNTLATADVVSDMNTLGSAAVVSDMNTVAGKATEIGRLGTADAVSDMNTLGTADVVSDMDVLGTTTNVANMNTVAGIASDVTGVAGKATQIGLLGTADAIADMDTLGTADVVSDMNTLGSAAVVANLDTVASNLSSVNAFSEQYRIAALAPDTSLDEGDLWFDTTSGVMKVYDGSGFINAGSSVNGIDNSVEHLVTTATDTFAATYDAGYLNVFLNGVKLDASDYTATDGANVVLDTDAAVGDTVYIHSFGTFALADHYTKTEADAAIAAGGVTGIESSADATAITIDSDENVHFSSGNRSGYSISHTYNENGGQITLKNSNDDDAVLIDAEDTGGTSNPNFRLYNLRPAGGVAIGIPQTSTGNIHFYTNGFERQVIHSNGNVELRGGIDFMLRNTANSWDWRLRQVNNQLDFHSGGDLTNPKVSFLNNGNVGIGTDDPDYTLSIGDANATENIAVSNRAFFGYHSNNAVVQGTTGKGISFCTNSGAFGSGERLRITSDGRGLSQFTAKAWVNIKDSTQTVANSHNISSVSDDGVGKGTINFANTMGNSSYAVATHTEDGSGFNDNPIITREGTQTRSTTAFGYHTYMNGGLNDATRTSFIFYGD